MASTTYVQYRDRPLHVFPAGTIITTVATTAPSGWLFCNGQQVSRALYAKLFRAIGTKFGEGDGSSTFHLPDLRGRVIVGCDDATYTIGVTGGQETYQLEVDDLPSHTHTATTASSGSHTHTATTGSAGAHTHTHNATGSPYSLTTYSGSNTMNSDVNGGSEPDLYAGAVALNINSAGAHTHDMTVTTDGAHTHAVTVDATGGNREISRMQPYLVLNYLIHY